MKTVSLDGLRHATALTIVGLALSAAACGGGAAKDSAAGGASSTPAAAVAAGAPDGAQIFTRCQTCHQATGVGVPNTYPPLAGSEIANGPADIPIKVLLKGLMGPITVHGQKFDAVMPAYGVGVEMSDAEVAAVLTYVRSQWGNSAPAVTAEEVAKVRAEVAGKTGAWTAAELGLKP